MPLKLGSVGIFICCTAPARCFRWMDIYRHWYLIIPTSSHNLNSELQFVTIQPCPPLFTFKIVDSFPYSGSPALGPLRIPPIISEPGGKSHCWSTLHDENANAKADPQADADPQQPATPSSSAIKCSCPNIGISQ